MDQLDQSIVRRVLASRSHSRPAPWDAFENGTRGCSIAVLHMELSYMRERQNTRRVVFSNAPLSRSENNYIYVVKVSLRLTKFSDAPSKRKDITRGFLTFSHEVRFHRPIKMKNNGKNRTSKRFRKSSKIEFNVALS